MGRRTHALEAEVRALDEGRAFVDRAPFRKVEVTGVDAVAWLNDLVTAGVEGLSAGEARRSLLLTPTGRIRADFHVVRTGAGYLLLQDPSQPRAVDDLLSPYVLSSDVRLLDVTDRLALFSLPGRMEIPDDLTASRPAMLGDGADVVVTSSEAGAARAALAAALVEAGEEAVEVWRVRRGVARFPVDVDEDSLPAEAGLEPVVDLTKGCFLGQESVAKVWNLGHPPRVVLALRAEGPVAPGEPVVTGGREVGRVTSAAPAPDGMALLARVRWEARSEALTTVAGEPLRPARMPRP
ncbi:MAG: hypothetical protein HYU54_01635 [Actinobacteria bacterium]|nr:hypothetical protein [Actinomycetota bacterium]